MLAVELYQLHLIMNHDNLRDDMLTEALWPCKFTLLRPHVILESDAKLGWTSTPLITKSDIKLFQPPHALKIVELESST